MNLGRGRHQSREPGQGTGCQRYNASRIDRQLYRWTAQEAVLSVWACSESLKTLVVSSSGRRILGFDLEILVVDWRRGGAERYCAIAQRDEGVWASYCLQHLAFAIKLVDICCVLVTDPIGIIIPKHKTFSVK